ncbi:GlxA family transcriptional regulator [Mesobacterium pallidum]|uniref:GlxA family transcriptional regulator n=1 Tax=Mesobacterium pallidum TaxID=2872037 RepID=UPI001EE33D8E|nr:GlxA family transcriptional regulator [Mesobacterium pallidum]
MPRNPASHLPEQRLRVAFLLADRFTLTAFASFVDVLRLAADDDDRSRPILCDWTVLGETLDGVTSSCGVKVEPNTRFRNAPAADYVVVVGGLIGDESALRPEALRFLRDRAEAGVPIIGLCTGVFILQEAGLLNGYRCCVSWFHHQDFLDRFDRQTPVSDQLFVVDRDRLTCSGGHGAAHLAAFLIDRHIGTAAAQKSLNILMVDGPLSGERPQPGQQARHAPRDALVKRALLKMQQNIGVPRTVAEIAEAVGVGRRSLERRFLADLGATPAQVYLDLRLDRALQKLRATSEPVAEVALATGFCDGSHLTRVLRKERGLRPTEVRAEA